MRKLLCALLLCAACPKPALETKKTAPPKEAITQTDFSQRGAQVNEALTRAAKAYQEKDYATFASAMEETTKLSPYNPDLQYRLARAYALAQKTDEAIATLETLVTRELVYPLNHPDLAGIAADPRLVSLASRTEQLAEPIHPSSPLATLSAQNLLIEGIAYDPQEKSFYLGSVHKKELYMLDQSGQVTPFFSAPVEGMYGVFGMKLDPGGRRLWVASSATPEVEGVPEAEQGRAGVFCFDLSSRALVASYPAPTDGKAHVFGDLALGPSGEVYVSDSASGELFVIKDNRLETLLPAGYLRSPQGIAVSPDGAGFFVTEYTSGLYWFDTTTKKLYWVDTPANMSRYGMDGLSWSGDELLIIQNGARPARVLRLELAKDHTVTRAESAERGHPEMLEPTLGVVAEQRFCYVASSQWTNFEGPTLAKETTDARLWCLPLKTPK